MSLTTQVMNDEQRKSVALEYLKAFDNGGVTSTGESILDLFAADAQVYFPKWGLANGREEIGRLFGDVGATIRTIRHDYARVPQLMVTWIDRDRPWRPGFRDVVQRVRVCPRPGAGCRRESGWL